MIERRGLRTPRKGAGSALASRELGLLSRVLEIVEAARGHAARSVNSAMVHANWMIGREIVEVEQGGERRAGYGDEVIQRLARELVSRLGKGFGERTLRRLRLFYLTYPKGSSLPAGEGDAPMRTAPPSRSSGRKLRTAPLSRSAAPVAVDFSPIHGCSRYQMYLPTESEFRAELARDRARAERALRSLAEPDVARPSKKGKR